jgi:hypothetical protein
MTQRTRWGVRAQVAAVVACLLLPGGALAQPTDPPEAPPPRTVDVIVDLLILRPLALVVLPVGVAAFIPAALLTGPGALFAPEGEQNLQTALELFVTGPASYVFLRRPGDI